jgi:hypothetical protein
LFRFGKGKLHTFPFLQFAIVQNAKTGQVEGMLLQPRRRLARLLSGVWGLLPGGCHEPTGVPAGRGAGRGLIGGGERKVGMP